MTTIIALAAIVQLPAFSQATVSGIVVTEFDTPQGRIQVYLPDDMAAGDTISGTVFSEPKGTGSALESNIQLIRGAVVSIDKTLGTRSANRVTISGLDKAHKLGRELNLKIGDQTYTAPIEVDPLRTDKDTNFVFPEVAPSGRPMLIVGPFDGDNGTTNVSVGGKLANVLVESPRSCVVQQDASFVGRKTVSVSDAGKAGDGSVVLPKIVLTAAKTALARGERTQITVTVQGLEGAPDSVYPIPLELMNQSPSIIDMPRYVNWAVDPVSVRDGTWTRTIDVTATNPGSFVVTGMLFMVKLHDAKSAMTPEEFNYWMASLKVMYQEKLKKLQEDAKAQADRNGGKVDAALSANIDRKKNIITLIESGAVSSEGEKQGVATMIDKLLSAESMFGLAAELLTSAADFLGYTDLPLPGIGAVLKGAKAVVKKLPKVVKAIEKAEKLHEELEKITDAKEKAEKALEVKKAVEDAQKVLDGEK